METFSLFWGGPYSQWAKGKFQVNGNEYNTAEQAMMFGKAVVFQDGDIAKQIMKTTEPKKQKALGRKVKNFDAEAWDKVNDDIVYSINFAKFTQNPNYLRLLLADDATTIVEASPLDTIWGIGLAADNPDCHNRDKWLGLNKLGQVLTDLRGDLLTGNHDNITNRLAVGSMFL